MATAKHRINISVSKETLKRVKLLASRDEEPLATKASNLIKMALRELYGFKEGKYHIK